MDDTRADVNTLRMKANGLDEQMSEQTELRRGESAALKQQLGDQLDNLLYNFTTSLTAQKEVALSPYSLLTLSLSSLLTFSFAVLYNSLARLSVQ